MIDHRSYAHNLSSCEIKAHLRVYYELSKTKNEVFIISLSLSMKLQSMVIILYYCG